MRDFKERFAPVFAGMFVQLILFAVIGTWQLGNVKAAVEQRIAIAESREADRSVRIDRVENNAKELEGKLITELRLMRADVNQRLDRLEDRLDRGPNR